MNLPFQPSAGSQTSKRMSESGVGLIEPITRQNAASLKLLFRTPLSVSDGAPVYLSRVPTAQGIRDLLFATSTTGTLAAYDACTGAQGFRDALQMAKLTADRLDLDPSQVLVATTGVIGRYLPMDAVKRGIAGACATATPNTTTPAGSAPPTRRDSRSLLNKRLLVEGIASSPSDTTSSANGRYAYLI